MVFDTENLENLTIKELGLLLLLYDKRVDKSRTVVQVKDVDIYELLDSLERKKYVISSIYSTDFNYRPPYKHTMWSLVEKGKQVLAENCMQTVKEVKTISTKELVSRCDSLADKLMELYPAGTKPGTSLKWRGYKKGVSEKLQKLIKNGNEFTDEEAINATKAYINSFGGMYTTMRVLPYFLSKNEIVGGESKKTCDFMSYVEDLRNNTKSQSTSVDWTIELR